MQQLQSRVSSLQDELMESFRAKLDLAEKKERLGAAEREWAPSNDVWTALTCRLPLGSMLPANESSSWKRLNLTLRWRCSSWGRPWGYSNRKSAPFGSVPYKRRHGPGVCSLADAGRRF